MTSRPPPAPRWAAALTGQALFKPWTHNVLAVWTRASPDPQGVPSPPLRMTVPHRAAVGLDQVTGRKDHSQHFVTPRPVFPKATQEHPSPVKGFPPPGCLPGCPRSKPRRSLGSLPPARPTCLCQRPAPGARQCWAACCFRGAQRLQPSHPDSNPGTPSGEEALGSGVASSGGDRNSPFLPGVP